MSQQLTLDPSSFIRLLAAASVLNRRPAPDETRGDTREREAEPHRAFEYDAISASTLAAFNELSKVAEAGPDQNTVLERATALSSAVQLVPPLGGQAGDPKQAPHGSSFRPPKTDKILAWRVPLRLSRRITSKFLAQPNKLAGRGKYLCGSQSPRFSVHGAAGPRSLSGLPTGAFSQGLRHIMASLARYRVKAWVTYDSKFTLSQRQAVTKAMTPLVVLLIMVAFTLTEVSSHGHFLTITAVSRMNQTSDHGTVRRAGQFRPPPAYQGSHMQVTDRVVLSVVEALSRYEIPVLRRQADYGDDSAALIMGMVYETGHFVPRSCTKAATWVTSSANAGNAGAQYNLGLRYRDGDGVLANEDKAEKWLRKSARSSGIRMPR